MPWDLAFDPISGNLIRDDAGGWEIETTGNTAVLNQLTIHWNSWWADFLIGSRFHEADLFTGDSNEIVAEETRRCLQLLIDENLIADLEVVAVEQQAGRVGVRTKYRLVATGQDIDTFLPIMPPGA
jgi:hypothetical protein